MNFHSTSGGKNVEKHPHNCECSDRKRVFDDPRALGVHQRAHREGAHSRKCWNIPGRSGNSLSLACPPPNPHMAAQFKDLSGGSGNNQGAAFGKAMPSMIYPKRLHPNNNGWVNVDQFPENRVGNTKTPLFVSQFPEISSSAGGHTEIRHINPFPHTASAPTYCINPSAIPPNHSFLLGPGNVCHLNADPSRPFMGGGQFSGNASKNFQYPNQGAYAVAIPGPLLGSNQLPALREPSNIGSSFPYQNHLSGRGEFSQYNENRPLTHQGVKRSCFGEAPHTMKAAKRPKINCNLTMETAEHQKEELLYKDVEKSFADLEISVDVNEEPETDLDLSLHL